MTKYVPLHRAVDASTWTVLATIEASSSSTAKRLAAETHGESGEYVAVPESSWDPSPATVHATPKVTFEKQPS